MCSIQGHAIATSRSYDNYQNYFNLSFPQQHQQQKYQKNKFCNKSNTTHKHFHPAEKNVNHYGLHVSLQMMLVLKINSLCTSKQSQLADIYRTRDDCVQLLFGGSNVHSDQ